MGKKIGKDDKQSFRPKGTSKIRREREMKKREGNKTSIKQYRRS